MTYRKHIVIFQILALLFGATLAFAQDRQGNDTAGDWLVKYYKSFGLWDTACDERMENGALKQRCYIRYVDVFSPRPKFGAVFMFFHTVDGKTEVELGLERGTQYNEDGFVIWRNDEAQWRFEGPCLSGSKCVWRDDEAQTVIAQFNKGGVLKQDFTDRHRQPQQLAWDLTPFAQAYEAYIEQSNARNLLK